MKKNKIEPHSPNFLHFTTHFGLFMHDVIAKNVRENNLAPKKLKCSKFFKKCSACGELENRNYISLRKSKGHHIFQKKQNYIS